MDNIGYLDARFQQMVLGVPRAGSLISRLKRAWFCYRHGTELKMFFLGLMTFDAELKEEDKYKFGIWLQDVDWSRLLSRIAIDVAHRRDNLQHEHPLLKSIIGENGEYRRLIRCCLNGFSPRSPFVI